MQQPGQVKCRVVQMPLANPQICPGDRRFSSPDIRHNQIEPDPELMPSGKSSAGRRLLASPAAGRLGCPVSCSNPRAPVPVPAAPNKPGAPTKKSPGQCPGL